MQRRVWSILFSLIWILLLFSGCTVSAEQTIFAMDTVMTLRVYGAEAEAAVSAAVQTLFDMDALWSVTGETSDIARLNTADGVPVSVNPSTYHLVSAALQAAERFPGSFDPTIHPVMNVWGFYDEALRLPDPAALTDALSRVDAQSIVLQEDGVIQLANRAALDLGGIAKGYASDCIRDLLLEYGIESALINLGGNVFAHGSKPDGKPWLVAVRHPIETDSYLCTLSVSDLAVITSGGYERYLEIDGERYHHIMDPKTGYPAQSDLASVTILSSRGVDGDVLSTALFVMGFADATEYWRQAQDFEAIFVLQDGSVWITEGAEVCMDSCDFEYQILVM